MSLVSLAGKIKGHVVICADGFFTERFLNICMHRKIFLWDVRRCGENRIQASVNISDFARLRRIARKTRTRVRIVKRCGLPFYLYRYRNRKPIVLGIVLFAAVMWYFSSHVVGIDISGNERIAAGEVMRSLAESGVYPGAAIRKIDHHEVQNLMMTKLDDAAWVGINIKGSRVYVEIKERLDTKREVGRDIPCNLVASNDGIIEKTEIREGQSMVKVGDMVEKGDLLVSGAVDSVTSGIRYAHSFGEVYAKTAYRETREYSLEYTEKIFTGDETKRYRVEVMGKSLNLFLNGKQPYEYSEKTDAKTEYRIPGIPAPSVFVGCETYRAFRPEKKKRNIDEAVALGKKELCRELDKKIPKTAEVTDKNITYRLSAGGKVAVSAEYICIENIALQTPIDKIENMNYDIDKNNNVQN